MNLKTPRAESPGISRATTDGPLELLLDTCVTAGRFSCAGLFWRRFYRPLGRRGLAALIVLAFCLSGCSSAATDTAAGRSSAAPAGWWHPHAGLTWQWQLSGTVDTSVNVQVYDIDGDTGASVVAALHAAGRKVICYVDTGSYESFRADAGGFPASVLGKPNGWPGERWLDIRQIPILKPIMAARFAACAKKGFDGIEADNVDGYENDTGFALTADDQLAYNRMLAALAHADGLAIGLKNDVDQVGQLLPYFDFSVDEQCFEYQECDELEPFIQAGKPVFEVEYNLQTSQFCTQATALGFSSMRKNLALDAPRWPCPV
jgi:hypothetical protein